jgi:hypothetical protein
MARNRITYGDELVLRDGKVGIGTTDPKANLSVFGSLDVSGDLRIVSAGVTEGEIITQKHYRDNGGSIVYQSGDQHLFSVSNEGDLAYVISDSDGTPVLQIAESGISTLKNNFNVTNNISIGGTLGLGSSAFFENSLQLPKIDFISSGSSESTRISAKHYSDNNGSVVYQSGDQHLFSVSNEGDLAYVISDSDGTPVLQIAESGISTLKNNFNVTNNISIGGTLGLGSSAFFENSLQLPKIDFISSGSSESTRISAKHYSDNNGSVVYQSGESNLFSIDNDSDVYYSINDSEAKSALTVSSTGITTIRDLFQNTVNFTSAGSSESENIQLNHYRNIAYQPAVGSTTNNSGAISFDSPAGVSVDGVTYFPASLFALTNGGGNIFSVSGYNYFSGSLGIPSIDVTQSGRVGFGTTNPTIDIDIARETYFTGPNVIFRNKAQIQDKLILSETLSPVNTSTTSITIEPLTQGVTTYVPTRSATLFRGELDQSLNGGQLVTILNNNSSLLTINRFVGLSSAAFAPAGERNIETIVEVRENGNVGVGTTNPSARFNVVGNSVFSGITTLGLTSTTSPTTNSTMSFELTDNNTLTVRVRGTDGVVRTGIVTLS